MLIKNQYVHHYNKYIQICDLQKNKKHMKKFIQNLTPDRLKNFFKKKDNSLSQKQAQLPIPQQENIQPSPSKKQAITIRQNYVIGDRIYQIKKYANIGFDIKQTMNSVNIIFFGNHNKFKCNFINLMLNKIIRFDQRQPWYIFIESQNQLQLRNGKNKVQVYNVKSQKNTQMPFRFIMVPSLISSKQEQQKREKKQYRNRILQDLKNKIEQQSIMTIHAVFHVFQCDIYQDYINEYLSTLQILNKNLKDCIYTVFLNQQSKQYITKINHLKNISNKIYVIRDQIQIQQILPKVQQRMILIEEQQKNKKQDLQQPKKIISRIIQQPRIFQQGILKPLILNLVIPQLKKQVIELLSKNKLLNILHELQSKELIKEQLQKQLSTVRTKQIKITKKTKEIPLPAGTYNLYCQTCSRACIIQSQQQIESKQLKNQQGHCLLCQCQWSWQSHKWLKYDIVVEQFEQQVQNKQQKQREQKLKSDIMVLNERLEQFALQNSRQYIEQIKKVQYKLKFYNEYVENLKQITLSFSQSHNLNAELFNHKFRNMKRIQDSPFFKKAIDFLYNPPQKIILQQNQSRIKNISESQKKLQQKRSQNRNKIRKQHNQNLQKINRQKIQKQL